MAKQVKSKQRFADHGEVFTAEREVNGELGYYYWCPAIELNGMGEDIDEILRLVKEILPSPK